MSQDNSHAHDTEHHGHYIVPAAAYVAVFIGLLILTVVTVAVAQVDLGPANLPVAMLVATLKASLVALIFMQLKYDNRLNALVFVFGLLFLALFFLFTLLDVFSREYIEPRLGNHTIQAEEVRAMQNKAADTSGVNSPVKPGGIAADMPPKDEWVPPPPPPTLPDGGLPDGGLPVEGSVPGSEPGAVAVPGSEGQAVPPGGGPATVAPAAPTAP
jgi:cytochrome c oxidase subunit 4